MEEVVIDGFVDGVLSVTGTSDPVTGLTNGSTLVTCAGLDEKRVRVFRGSTHIAGIPDIISNNFYTKYIIDSYITFSQQLIAGEYIYIKTIPV